MNTRNTASLMIFASALGLSQGCEATAKNPDKKTSAGPNFVLFLADDCSYTDLQCYGSPNSLTPRINEFAQEGMQFMRAAQAAPISSPTRHNLFTGLWPMVSGAYPNHTFAAEGTKSIVHQLHPLGYQVALIGKSHISPDSVFPFDFKKLSNDDLDFEAVSRFMSDNKKNNTPFCMLVTSNNPHGPYTHGDPSLFPPEKLVLPPHFVDTPQTRREYSKYLAEVNYMDSEFGHVLDLIEEQGLEDNTFVIYLSEQGNGFPFAKWTCFDVGVRSGCIVRWPGVTRPGTKSDAIVEYVDVVPTFVDIAGGKPVAKMDGKSFKKVLQGKTGKHKKYTFSQSTTRGVIKASEYYGIRAASDGKYRYILNLTPEVEYRNSTVYGPLFKSWVEAGKTDERAAFLANKYRWRPAEELYDVENDPYCLENLIDDPALAKKKAELSKALKEWMDYCGDKGQETEMDAYNHMHEWGWRKHREFNDQLKNQK